MPPVFGDVFTTVASAAPGDVYGGPISAPTDVYGVGAPASCAAAKAQVTRYAHYLAAAQANQRSACRGRGFFGLGDTGSAPGGVGLVLGVLAVLWFLGRR